MFRYASQAFPLFPFVFLPSHSGFSLFFRVPSYLTLSHHAGSCQFPRIPPLLFFPPPNTGFQLKLPQGLLWLPQSGPPSVQKFPLRHPRALSGRKEHTPIWSFFSRLPFLAVFKSICNGSLKEVMTYFSAPDPASTSRVQS